jgi:hypothetical protein
MSKAMALPTLSTAFLAKKSAAPQLIIVATANRTPTSTAIAYSYAWLRNNPLRLPLIQKSNITPNDYS